MQVIMVGNGVGIAPMRAFCQESAFNILTKKPNPFGQIAVFFGTKTKDDRLFNSDFETSQKTGALDSYLIGYSRETEIPKTYAQEVMTKNSDIIVELLMKKKGVVFVCGSNPLRKGVISALELILMDAGYEDTVKKMITEGKIMFECFGSG